jgi:hypothetical protein
MSIVDKLTPNPLQPEGSKPLPPKEALTPDEQALLDRCRTFIVSALKRHGISINSTEVQWIGAEVADFVMGELNPPEPVVEKAEPSQS